LHLLYARFFYKYFHDKGWIAGRDEPFERLFNQGLVLRNGVKMSKSLGNTVGIDDVVERYGVDAMRMFLLKATPPEDTMEWSDEGIEGRIRFLNRVWRACAPLMTEARAVPLDRLPEMRGDGQREIVRALHATLRSAAEEARTHRFHWNTTLARLDELINAMTKFSQSGSDDDPALLYAVHALPLVMAPFAPHIADELWESAGYTESVHLQRWIEYDPAALAVDEIELVVQVNGKVRARLSVAPGTDEETVAGLAFAEPNVAAHLEGKTVRKQIFVADKLFNIVAN